MMDHGSELVPALEGIVELDEKYKREISENCDETNAGDGNASFFVGQGTRMPATQNKMRRHP